MVRRRDGIFQVLAENRDRIRGFGVRSLALFGSAARGEASAGSDLDSLMEFDRKTFDNCMGLKEYLEELFSCRVDLVLAGALKPRLRETTLSSAVHAPGL
ncbi:nucleotidyltransferase family protein [candidate division WOR-3 bacterium]|nr:nucleotidyltransferase family protein [candidate division WOR-3 bacterium]